MQKEIRVIKEQKNINCNMCSKNIVCTLYRGISTLINNNWVDKKPFLPENIAMICKYFTAEMKENL